MNRAAFIFSQPPHGSSIGREGLDAVLATATLSDEVGLFFIGDGVFQLLSGQRPEKILARDYIATFGILPLYDINQVYLCESSLLARGLSVSGPWILPTTLLSSEALRTTLTSFDCILTF